MLKDILKVLEDDARTTSRQIATMTGHSAAEVTRAIRQAEKDRVILKYKTVINWDKVLRVLDKFVEKLWHRSRLDLVVDAALFVLAVTAMVSGLMVSQVVLPAVGLTITPTMIWKIDSVALPTTTITGTIFPHLTQRSGTIS